MAKRTCSILGCGKRHRSLGWCEEHYRHARKYGDPLVTPPPRSRESTRKPYVDGLKVCSSCNRGLPLVKFGVRAKTWDGLSGTCKNCLSARGRQYRQEYRESIRIRKRKWYQQNRPKIRAANSRWRLKNAEKVRTYLEQYRADPAHQQIAYERTRAWSIAHPNRVAEHSRRRYALKKAGVATRIPMGLLDAKLAYWGGRCWIAGPRCTVDPETWDHVKPLSKGGPHCLANLRPACKPCNCSKKARWPYPVTGGPAWRVAF